MHDLVAHSMSVMVVQAGGARRILDRDPARALEAATRIERAGREALGEMRHLLGVLNGTDQPPALAPQPKLAEIGELVGHARAAGLPTVLEFRGERRSCPPASTWPRTGSSRRPDQRAQARRPRAPRR